MTPASARRAPLRLRLVIRRCLLASQDTVSDPALSHHTPLRLAVTACQSRHCLRDPEPASSAKRTRLVDESLSNNDSFVSPSWSRATQIGDQTVTACQSRHDLRSCIVRQADQTRCQLVSSNDSCVSPSRVTQIGDQTRTVTACHWQSRHCLRPGTVHQADQTCCQAMTLASAHRAPPRVVTRR